LRLTEIKVGVGKIRIALDLPFRLWSRDIRRSLNIQLKISLAAGAGRPQLRIVVAFMTAAPRSYTAEQVAAVQRVRTCAADAHYIVLGLSDGSRVEDVKKAFKGVSLPGWLSIARIVSRTSAHHCIVFSLQLARQLHPDKNAAPGAEEAMQRAPPRVRGHMFIL